MSGEEDMMEWELYLAVLLLGLISSFLSGLFGIGGAIINYPLLLFIPAVLGMAQFTGQEVSAISMFQVFFASLAGIIAYHKKNKKARDSLIHKGLVIVMGPAILFGSLIGGIGSKYLTGEIINVIYGLLAITALALMFSSDKAQFSGKDHELTFNKAVAGISAFIVGIVSGIVGAGGAFILIPIMLAVLKIPLRVTVATSLAIVFISAIGGVLGKLTTGHIPLLPTVFTILGSLWGAPIGAKVSSKVDGRVLQIGLIILILFTVIKIWTSILL